MIAMALIVIKNTEVYIDNVKGKQYYVNIGKNENNTEVYINDFIL